MDRKQRIKMLETAKAEVLINRLRFVPAVIQKEIDLLKEEDNAEMEATERAELAGGWPPDATAHDRKLY